MEYDNVTSPEENEAIEAQVRELAKLAVKIFDLARNLKVYSDAPSAELFSIIDDIQQKVVNDERVELGKLITLLLSFNEQKVNLIGIKPRVKIFVSHETEKGIGVIAEY